MKKAVDTVLQIFKKTDPRKFLKCAATKQKNGCRAHKRKKKTKTKGRHIKEKRKKRDPAF